MRGIKTAGIFVRNARLKSGLTQEQLAALAGIDPKTVRKAERGDRLDLGTLSKLCFALDVDLASLAESPPPGNLLEISRRDAVIGWNRAWDARDLDAVVNAFHPDAVMYLPGDPNIPFSGAVRGHEAIRKFFQTAWANCETVPSKTDEFSLFVSSDTVVLSGEKGVRLPDGSVEYMSAILMFSFLPETNLIFEHRAEYDTLKMAKLMNYQEPPRPLESPEETDGAAP